MSWIEDLTGIVGTSKDVIERVEETLQGVIGQQHPSPVAIPKPAAEEQSKPAQAEGGQKIEVDKAPAWLLPVAAILAVIFLLR